MLHWFIMKPQYVQKNIFLLSLVISLTKPSNLKYILSCEVKKAKIYENLTNCLSNF